MPRKPDQDTRIHFRAYEDEEHAQKRAWCLHCHKDACADNIQRMRNHLIRCDAFRNSIGNEPVFSLENPGMDGPVAPDTTLQQMQNGHPHTTQGGHMQAPGGVVNGQGQPPLLDPPFASGPASSSPVQDPGAPGPSHQQQDPNHPGMSMQPPLPPQHLPPHNTGAIIHTPGSSKSSKNHLNSLDKVRQAMGRSTKRMESLEAVLKTQVSDGMNNAATHVRAAIRDERDRLFKLSQTLVKQEMRLREMQTSDVQY